MSAAARPAPASRLPAFDPLRRLWDLLTNVKFALVLVGLAGLAALLGVVIPQLPGPMRSNAAARSAWLELQRDDFGPLTGVMDRLDLFEVFHSPWFNGLWFVIIVAVTVCTVSRFRPTWRSVHRPSKDVPERYFETAHHRADYSHPGGATAVERALRARRYRVETTREDATGSYLFAQRYGWSAYGTFLSHLALLMLLVGGLLTRFAGFDESLVLAEGTPGAPVFANPGPGQMFVRVADAYRGRDAAGNIVDFHTDLEVTRGGRTVTCTTTVNDPCSAFGYRIHQAAFFDDVGRLRITAPGGQLVFDDVVDFDSNATAVPAFRVTDNAGRVLYSGAVPQMGTDPGASPGREDDVAVAQLVFPAEAGSETLVAYALAWRVEGQALRLTIAGPGLAPRALTDGTEVAAGPYRIRYDGPRSIPAMRIDDMPGATNQDDGVVLQMVDGMDGRPYLFVTGVAADNVVLPAGAPVSPGNGYTYTFGGRVEASGLSVRRDPGDTFIWVAVGMALVGLGITFYVPRRRLWVKVTGSRTYFAGVAERTTRLGRELRLMGAELGSRDALRPGDADE